MIRAKMADLRYSVISGGPFCIFSSFEFFVLRSGAYEYVYGNFRECSSFISQFYGVFQNLIDRAVWT